MRILAAVALALVWAGDPKVMLGDKELTVDDIRKLDLSSLKDGESVTIVKQARSSCGGPKVDAPKVSSRARTWSGARETVIDFEGEVAVPEGSRKASVCVRAAVLTKTERGDALDLRRLDLGEKGEAKEGEKRALKGSRTVKVADIDAEIKECAKHGGRLALVVESEDGHGCAVTRIVLVARKE